jgi:uncharacterized protein
LALIGRAANKVWVEFNPAGHWIAQRGGYTDEGVLLRQELSSSGEYLALVENFYKLTFFDYFASGMILGWLSYVLGRFLIGAWVGRKGWIEHAREVLPGWRRVRNVGLLSGLVLEGLAVMLAHASWLGGFPRNEFIADCIHLVAAPILAAGYVGAIVVAFESGRGRAWLSPFAWVGRMALTNYLAQSFVIGLVLFGVGPGLALAGKIGTCALTGIVVVVFAMQMLASRWWLSRFAHGPMEWLWRWLTYR